MIVALIIIVNENNYHPTISDPNAARWNVIDSLRGLPFADVDVETSACPIIGAPVDVLEHRAFLGKG